MLHSNCMRLFSLRINLDLLAGQGQQVSHCGRRSVSANAERITMVTSYVPADPLLPDRSVLRGPRPVSDCSLLYYQWARYRLASTQAQVCLVDILQNKFCIAFCDRLDNLGPCCSPGAP